MHDDFSIKLTNRFPLLPWTSEKDWTSQVYIKCCNLHDAYPKFPSSRNIERARLQAQQLFFAYKGTAQ